MNSIYDELPRCGCCGRTVCPWLEEILGDGSLCTDCTVEPTPQEAPAEAPRRRAALPASVEL
jgi:hypothetical protein